MSRTHSARGLPWAWGSIKGAETLGDHAPSAGPGARLAARAVETDATPEALFLWLCQLRRAPYSYDWIDNFGRRSPRTPDPSMTDLEVGQPVMTIFTLSGFVPNSSLTLRMKPGWPTHVFGAITVQYAIVPIDDGRALLRGDLRMPATGGPLGRLRRYLLAWGDLLMMRKQLQTLCALAEGASKAPGAPASTPETRL